MFGSGARIGTVRIIINLSRFRERWPRIRQGRGTVPTRTNQAYPNGLLKAAHSSAQINTAPGTCPAAAAKKPPTQGLTTSVFVWSPIRIKIFSPLRRLHDRVL